jgi:hypothetical protein
MGGNVPEGWFEVSTNGRTYFVQTTIVVPFRWNRCFLEKGEFSIAPSRYGVFFTPIESR